MTFYNHIESVRGIAIDLTNGRKWRGASDKAAVFDSLDAARREYTRLSDENAKLRTELSTTQLNCDMWHDRAEDMRNRLSVAQAENAKLREIIGMIGNVCDGISEVCEYCKNYNAMNDECMMLKQMHELGVEVDACSWVLLVAGGRNSDSRVRDATKGTDR